MKTPTIFSRRCRPGASGYLLKRTPRAELLTAIKDVHAGGSPMSSNIARKIVQSFQRFSLSPAGNGKPFTARARGFGTARPRLSLQGNCRPAAHQRADGQHAHPPDLRKAACPLALASRCQIHPHTQRRRCGMKIPHGLGLRQAGDVFEIPARCPSADLRGGSSVSSLANLPRKYWAAHGCHRARQNCFVPGMELVKFAVGPESVLVSWFVQLAMSALDCRTQRAPDWPRS